MNSPIPYESTVADRIFYVQYADAEYRKVVEKPSHTGDLGPVIRAEVGDGRADLRLGTVEMTEQEVGERVAAGCAGPRAVVCVSSVERESPARDDAADLIVSHAANLPSEFPGVRAERP